FSVQKVLYLQGLHLFGYSFLIFIGRNDRSIIDLNIIFQTVFHQRKFLLSSKGMLRQNNGGSTKSFYFLTHLQTIKDDRFSKNPDIPPGAIIGDKTPDIKSLRVFYFKCACDRDGIFICPKDDSFLQLFILLGCFEVIVNLFHHKTEKKQ